MENQSQMNVLSIVSLIATILLFGGAIFLGVKNREETVRLRAEFDALEEQFQRGSGAQGAVSPAGAAPTSSPAGVLSPIEQQLSQQRDAEIAALRNELAIKTQENDTLERKFEQIQEEQSKPLTPVQQRIARAAVIAKVDEYLPDMGFVVLDGGSNRRLETGMNFHVRRDHYIIGEITIGETVEEATCVADLKPGSIPSGYAIEKGDEIIQYLP